MKKIWKGIISQKHLLQFMLIFGLLLGSQLAYFFRGDFIQISPLPEIVEAKNIEIIERENKEVVKEVVKVASEPAQLAGPELTFVGDILELKNTDYDRFVLDFAEQKELVVAPRRFLLAGFEVVLPRPEETIFQRDGRSWAISKADLAELIDTELAPRFEISKKDARIESLEGEPFFRGVARVGRVIDRERLLADLAAALSGGDASLQIHYKSIQPDLKIADEFTQLGIRDLLGSTEMDYPESSPERTQNVSAAANKLNGQLIAPGMEWSYNAALFPLSKRFFTEAPVIKGGELVEELGGGVCQVSSGIFRAALRAGLPITEQYPHSQKLVHYQPPGLDAAVYPGSKDFRFLNDTKGHVLIQAVTAGQTLQINFFGMADGRAVDLSGPFYLDGTPVTDLNESGLRLLWQRELTQAVGEITREDWRASYWR